MPNVKTTAIDPESATRCPRPPNPNQQSQHAMANTEESHLVAVVRNGIDHLAELLAEIQLVGVEHEQDQV